MTKSEITGKAIQQLTYIGFTQLESEIYLHLLSHGEATGYAIAKGIGKAVANVYKASESLVSKGGIEQVMDGSKLFIAVSWKSLLINQQKKFEKNINSLTECLSDYPEYQDDEHVYQLRNIEQVIEQTISMIEKAEHLILAEIGPVAVNWFASSLLEAVERGVDVRVKVYQPIELEGADAVIQAFRTKSALMNMALYCGLLYELILTDLKNVIPQGNIQAAQNILNGTKHLHPFSNENVVFQTYKQRYSNKPEIY